MKHLLMILFAVGITLSPVNAAESLSLSAASMTCPNGEPFLLFGQGLNDPALKLYVSDLKAPADWSAVASLQRLLDGNATAPSRPPAEAPVVGVHAADPTTATVKAFANEWNPQGKMIWAQTPAGFSSPLAINVPEIWTITPPRPLPGSRVRFFGINFPARGPVAALIVAGDGKLIECAIGQSYSGEKGISPAFERTLTLPADMAPGRYRLFVHCGGGDHGWSRPFQFEVVARPPVRKVYACADAPADGEADASIAIQKKIDEAAATGGGVVTLGPGNYLVRKTIRLKPGITLRGSGKAATTLLSPRDGQIPVIFHHYRSIIELADRSALEHVTVDATPGEDHHAVLIRGTTDAAVRHCEARNLRPVHRPEGKWVPADNVVSATQHTYRLVIEENVLRGETPFCHWGGEMADLYFAHNTCEGLPTHGSNVSFRGLRRAVVEHNRISRGGRGLVVAGEAVHNYFGFNIIENIRGTGNGCEMFLYELGGTPWQGHPAEITAGSFATPGKAWDEKTLRSTADSFTFTTYALVTAGRGIGQCIPIASAQGQTIRLSRPWTVPPDAQSEVMVVYGCMENIHIENQFKEGVAYSGVFGAAARNVWAGDEFERVSDGMVLWSLGRDFPVSLNLMRDLRLQDRAGILLIAGLETTKPIQQTVMLGNEIRTCQVYARQRYPGNEYGLGTRVWRFGHDNNPPGNARHVTFGHEAGIHLSAFFDWPGNHTDEDPKLDASVTPVRWTLVYDSLVARSPIGVRIGRAVTSTVVVDAVSAFNQRSVSDSGRNSVVTGMRETPAPRN